MFKIALSLVCVGAWITGAFAAEKPRVFITDSKSWEIAGGGGGSSAGFGGATRGGARPQTAEIIKTFGERCPQVIVNNKQEMADYVVLLDHEGGKGFLRKDNKVAVFNKSGDSIVSHSTRSLGGSVEDACAAIVKDWAEPAAVSAQPAAAAAASTPVPTPVSQASVAKASITSTPDRADIEIDGNYVGSTPSAVELAPGSHSIVVKKSGYQSWERKIVATSGSSVNVAADLEKSE
jgi:hypothetical protein